MVTYRYKKINTEKLTIDSNIYLIELKIIETNIIDQILKNWKREN